MSNKSLWDITHVELITSVEELEGGLDWMSSVSSEDRSIGNNLQRTQPSGKDLWVV